MNGSSAMMLRISKHLLPSAMFFSAACFNNCGGDDILTIAKPAVVESFELADSQGQTLWKFTCTPAATLNSLNYGKVPFGCTQIIPAAGRQPRPFTNGEALVT